MDPFKFIATQFRIIISLCCLMVASSARADEACSIDTAFIQLTKYMIKQNGDNASIQMPILKRLSELSSKATNNNLPIGVQLSKPDLEEFEQLSFKTLDYTLRGLFITNLHRDSNVLINVIRVGNDELAGKMPKKGSQDSEYFMLKMFIWATIPDLKFTRQSSGEGCSMVTAIENYEDFLVKDFDSQRVQKLAEQVRMYQEKYQLGTSAGWLDRMPSGADKSQAIQIDAELTSGKKTFDFVKILEKIKLIQQMSDRQFSMLSVALNKSKTRVEAEKISSVYDLVASPSVESEKKAMEMLNYIAQKFPSDSQQLSEKLYNPLREQGLIPNH